MQESNPENIQDTVRDHPERTRTLLLLRRCKGCGKLFAPTVTTCASCRSTDLTWSPSAGTGSLVCWRVVRQAPNAHTAARESMLAIVALDEGPWLYTTLEGGVPPSPRQPVRVRFRTQPRGVRFPIFTLGPD
ncbi:Zn-ribbon domain-containing OB-fold protein [Nocardia paucivorans]|uniref:Zn-ribbon domain-containing OB-fold protein n=1 Tax=Nocardia paucivorans TaxID=114259 RepID=UPI0002F3D175|nr:OB-fold domain-containing protein [Nocardia paucivorans]